MNNEEVKTFLKGKKSIGLFLMFVYSRFTHSLQFWKNKSLFFSLKFCKVLWHSDSFFTGDVGKLPILTPKRNLGLFSEGGFHQFGTTKKNTTKKSVRSSIFFSQNSIFSPKICLRPVRFVRQKVSASGSQLAVFAHIHVCALCRLIPPLVEDAPCFLNFVNDLTLNYHNVFIFDSNWKPLKIGLKQTHIFQTTKFCDHITSSAIISCYENPR
jgi:hypothetical protein